VIFTTGSLLSRSADVGVGVIGQNTGQGIVVFRASAPTPGGQRGDVEAHNQADDADGERPAQLRCVQPHRVAGRAQREEERADAKERSRHAQHAVDGNQHADMGGTGAASY
jgi:hypothetical protein